MPDAYCVCRHLRASLSTQDKDYGRTPLSWAAENGHDGIVKLLLETGKVDADFPLRIRIIQGDGKRVTVFCIA